MLTVDSLTDLEVISSHRHVGNDLVLNDVDEILFGGTTNHDEVIPCMVFLFHFSGVEKFLLSATVLTIVNPGFPEGGVMSHT